MKMMDTSEAHSLNFLRTIFAAGLIAASCLVMFATEARAAQDTPKNYSHILPLSVSGTQGVVGLRLPQTIYLRSRSAQLNDLRVFDANGAVMPFALYVPPAQTRIEHRLYPAKIFPVDAPVTGGAARELVDLDIKAAADGTLISVKTKSGKNAAHAVTDGESRLAGLVLDVRPTIEQDNSDSKSTRLFSALKFSLPPSIHSYSAQVWLEVSDDLKMWDTVGAAELSWLVNRDTQSLANDRLEFSPRSFRYARLTWRSGEPIQFFDIQAESTKRVAEAPQFETLSLQASAGKEPADLSYAAAVALPVEQVGLQFSEANIVFPAALGHYRELPSRQIGKPGKWQFVPLVQSTFYQITQDGQQRHSAELSLPPTHAALWVLRGISEPVTRPVLTLSWQPATLVFLTSGKAPYALAVGRDNASSAARDLSQVAPDFNASEIAKLEQTAVGNLQAQTGDADEDSNAAKATASAHQRLWLLWGVLLLGVAVLGFMVWRLLKGMSAKS